MSLAPKDSGVILVMDRGKTKNGTPKMSIVMDIKDDLHIDMRADILAATVGDALLAHHHGNISSGQKADGSGQQPELAIRRFAQRPGVKKAIDARRGPWRGYKTGVFADGLRRTASNTSDRPKKAVDQPPGWSRRGKTWKAKKPTKRAARDPSTPARRATTRILPPTNRNVFVAMELQRGNVYLFTEGAAGALVSSVVDAMIDAALEGEMGIE